MSPLWALIFTRCLLFILIIQHSQADLVSSKEKISKAILNPDLTVQTRVDTMTLLSESELQEFWSEEKEESLISRLDKLQHSFEELIYIEIKLVGFDQEVNLKESELELALKSTLYDVPVSAIKSNLTSGHILNIKKKFFFRVSKTEKSFANDLKDALDQFVTSAPDRPVPYNVIDDKIRSRYSESDHVDSYSIYFLNLDSKNKFKYLYVQEAENPLSCPTAIWAGKERYMWVDLSAATPSYGPHLWGEGGVTELNYLSLSFFLSNQGNIRNLIPTMASLVRKTAEFLIAPSLYYFPLPYKTQRTFHFIQISEGGRANPFNWDSIENKIRALPILPYHSIHFKKTFLELSQCTECALLLAQSRKRVGKYRRDYEEVNEEASIVEYLDSKEMHHWLKFFFAKLGDSSSDVVPVVLFHLDSQNLLLDESFQSVSFPDMIISVQSSGSHQTDMNCEMEAVVLKLEDATRSTFASILETAYSVAPTHQRWSSISNKVSTNYLWSVGRTPFGSFSPLLDTSFSQTEASARNIIYSEIHSVLTELNDLFAHFREHEVELADALSSVEHVEFVRRWNLFQYKMEEAKKLLSLGNFNSTYHFIHSMKLDVRGMHHLVHLAGRRLHTFLLCHIDQEKEKYFWIKAGVISSPLFFLAGFTYLLFQRILSQSAPTKLKK